MISGQKLAVRGMGRDLRKAINQLQEQVKSMRIASGRGYMVGHTALGQKLTLKNYSDLREINDLQIVRCQVLEVYGFWIRCRRLNSDLSDFTGGYIFAQRPETLAPNDTSSVPWMIEDSTLHGRPSYESYSGERTARVLTFQHSGETFRVYQWITPEYVVSDTPGLGSIIYCAKGVRGLLQLTTNYDGQEYNVDWLDLNVDGRRWTTGMQYVEVCVSGVTKHMWVQASGVGGVF